MIFPLGHENMQGRRWPVVSLVIIALNLFIFLGTKNHLQDENTVSPRVVAREHILFLSARFPSLVDAEMTPEVQSMVEQFKQDHPDDFKLLAANQRGPADAWEAHWLMRDWDPQDLKDEMQKLCKDYEASSATEEVSFFGKYGFVPSHPTPLSFITSQFLHAGWLHLIFNMWFLWLAGSILEDAWGRPAYTIFYLLAGVIGNFAYLLTAPHSDIPGIGASGAIAGLMGAFLARFPKVRIRLAWLFVAGFRIRLIRFFAPAYVILPLWLVGEIFSGILAHDNVGHWTHAAGFVFGMGGALLLKATGLEHTLNKKIEEKITWTADPQIVRANELLEQHQYEDAIAEAQQLLKLKPNSIDAYEIILKVQEKQANYTAQQETLGTLCRLYAASGNGQMAWDCYGLFENLGGKDIPAATRLELAKYLEKEQAWEPAIAQYQKIIEKQPNERTSLMALMACARICLKQNRIAEAEKYFNAAAASPVPHLDMDGMIAAGLKQCAAANLGLSAGAGNK